MFFTFYDSPIQRLQLVSDGRSLLALYTLSKKHHQMAARDWQENDGAAPFAITKQQLTDYFAGTLTQFELPLTLQGTPFQIRVWQALQTIPYGTTLSYGALAQRIGQPTAARAVGMANGRNPLSIVVPCHRVIGAKGQLTGYGGGVDRKQWLLNHERLILLNPSTTNGPFSLA
jgi:methylated-DNA-[protein]-cysteine S-methyltransferase